jgi:membrane protease YdiL (CAAX protease family)
MGKFSEQAANRWERVVLFVVFLFVIAISAKTLTTTPFFSQASKFIFPICGIFLGIILIAKIKFYQLYIRKDHDVKKLRRLMPWIVILGIANLIISFAGSIFEFLAIPKLTGDIFQNSLEQMIKFSTVGMVGSLVTILTAIIYFFLNSKIQKIEQAEASILLK